MGTHHGNLHQLHVTMSSVISFTLWAPMGFCLSHTFHKEELETGFGTNEIEWTWKVEIRKEELLAVGRVYLAISQYLH